MGFNSNSIAEVTEHRNILYKDGELRYWLDPEQLEPEEVEALIGIKSREKTCRYLGLDPDCDDKTLEQAEKAEAGRIDSSYAEFVAAQRAKEEQRVEKEESRYHVFLDCIQHITEEEVAGILW